MSAHWRLNIDVREEGHARALLDHLEAFELEHDISSAFHDRVFLDRHGAEVRAYPGDRDQASKVEELVKSLGEKHDWHVETQLQQLDDVSAEWVDASKGVPDDNRHRAQHAKIIAQERAISQKYGTPGWEVKVECPTHHDVLALVERLTKENIPTAHRWRYLVVGALDEDSGEQLAARIRNEAPEGTTTIVQASPQAVIAQDSPFVVFRGVNV